MKILNSDDISFDEKHHAYFYNGDLVTESVTRYLKEVGIAPNYKFAPQDILNSKADEGNNLHKEIELLINDNEPTYSNYGNQFAEWYFKNVKSAKAEQIFGLDTGNFIICGKCDIMGILNNGEFFLLDHKKTAKFNKEYVTWQCNLLAYMSGKDIPNLYCAWYNNDKIEIIELQKIADKDIEALLNNKLEIKVPESDIALELKIAEYEKQVKIWQKEIADRHKFIKENMLAKEMKKLEIGNVTYTIKSGFTSKRVDTKKLKEEHEDIYNECLKESYTKPSLQIKIKEE